MRLELETEDKRKNENENENNHIKEEADTATKEALKNYTKKQIISNWFYYHWKILAVCIIVVAAVTYFIIQQVNAGKNQPDYSFAYAGSYYLPDDLIDAFKTEIATLGEDLNGDGKVIIGFTQYLTNSNSSANPYSGEAAMVADISLMADLENMESTWFLTDDPAALQSEFLLFADSDGNLPAENDYSIDNRVYRWSDCPTLTTLDLGTSIDSMTDSPLTKTNQELLSGMYIGMRGYAAKKPENLEAYMELWNKIIE